MSYNFDKIIERRNTASMKWDQTRVVFGTDDLLPMWVADMDLPSPPQVVKALKQRVEHPIYGYTYRPDSYYQAFRKWQLHNHQWAVSRHSLSDAPGVIPALNIIINSFTEPQDQVLIQPPVYRPFFRVIQDNNRHLVESPLSENNGYYQMDFVDLRQKFASGVKMIIFCSPHNPVGRVWREDELRMLGELCLEYNVKIVCDEIWSDLVFQPHKHIPIATLSQDIANQTITCLAPSKTFNIAGLNNAIIVIDNQQWKEQYDKQLKRYDLAMGNVFAITAFEAAYEFGLSWLEELLGLLVNNHNLVASELTEYAKCQVTQAEGTYVTWLDMRKVDCDPDRLMQALVQRGKIGLQDGRVFGKQGHGFFRMNIGCPPTVVADAINRIKLSLADFI